MSNLPGESGRVCDGIGYRGEGELDSGDGKYDDEYRDDLLLPDIPEELVVENGEECGKDPGSFLPCHYAIPSFPTRLRNASSSPPPSSCILKMSPPAPVTARETSARTSSRVSKWSVYVFWLASTVANFIVFKAARTPSTGFSSSMTILRRAITLLEISSSVPE